MRKYRDLYLGFNINKSYLSGNNIVKNHPFAAKLNSKITRSLHIANEVLIDHHNEFLHIEELMRIITNRLGYSSKSPKLYDFAQTLIDELKKQERAGNAMVYANVVNIFLSYLKMDIQLHQIDYNLLMRWRTSMSNLKSSTINNYLRTIRIIWNEAHRRNLVTGASPFKPGLLPTINKSSKKAVNTLVLQYLERTRSQTSGAMRMAIDARLLQFYLQGIDMADLALIERKSIAAGYVMLKRFKNRIKASNPEVIIKIQQKAQAIINEYSGKYLISFPCLPSDPKAWHNYVGASTKLVDKHLALEGYPKLGAKAIRHTWLTIASNLTDNYLLPKVAVGHSIGDTTARYIKIQQQDIDNLNAAVINSITLSITKPDSNILHG